MSGCSEEYYCTIDLRLEGKPIKLRVKKEDSFPALVDRLSQLAPNCKHTHTQLAQKLSTHLTTLLSNGSSTPFHLRMPLQAILANTSAQSIGAPSSGQDLQSCSQSNETPFKALQESVLGAKQVGDYPRGEYNHTVGVRLRNKYVPDEIFQKCHIQQSQSKPRISGRHSFDYLGMVKNISSRQDQMGNHVGWFKRIPKQSFSSQQYQRSSMSPCPKTSMSLYPKQRSEQLRVFGSRRNSVLGSEVGSAVCRGHRNYLGQGYRREDKSGKFNYFKEMFPPTVR